MGTKQPPVRIPAARLIEAQPAELCVLSDECLSKKVSKDVAKNV